MLRDWDDSNRDHIAKHGVLPEEVEEDFEGEMFEVNFHTLRDEERYEELGVTAAGRILFVVTTIRGKGIRVVTAYAATRSQRLRWLAFERTRYE